jgi:hypothetical protein
VISAVSQIKCGIGERFPFGLIGSIGLTLVVSRGVLFWVNSDTLPALSAVQRNVLLAAAFLLVLSTMAKSKIINYSRPTNRQNQTVYLTLGEPFPRNLVKNVLIQFFVEYGSR